MLPDTTLLADAKAWLRARLRDGERCPLCSQRAQIYRRPINARMALALIELRRAATPGDWVHLPTIVPNSGDPAKLRYWQLIEEELVQRPDGGRAGYYRLTDRGLGFLTGTVTVPRYALIYDSRLLGFEGEPVTIADCLGRPFDLDALLAGAA